MQITEVIIWPVVLSASPLSREEPYPQIHDDSAFFVHSQLEGDQRETSWLCDSLNAITAASCEEA